MSDSEENYEVESITRARVVKKNARGKKLIWHYRVRWKGYGTNEDTWEPAESFEGSEHILQQFWERAKRQLNGRDINDMSQFHVDEEFYTVGPPQGRKTKRQPVMKDDNDQTSVSSPGFERTAEKEDDLPFAKGKRKRLSPDSSVIDVDVDVHLPKRPRGKTTLAPLSHQPAARPLPRRSNGTSGGGGESASAPSRNHKHSTAAPKRKQRSSEIVPASEGSDAPPASPAQSPSPVPIINIDDDMLDVPSLSDNPDTGGRPPRYREKRRDFCEPTVVDVASDNAENRGVPHTLVMNNPVASTSTNQHDSLAASRPVPFHHARAANPLVKEAPFTPIAEGIPTKSRVWNSKASPATLSATSPKRAKPGPGRSSSGFIPKNVSSRLVAEKGKLKTVKGKYTAPGPAALSPPSADAFPATDSLFGDYDPEPAETSTHVEPSAPTAPPPTGEELLKLAGLNHDAAVLEDFEDEVTPNNPATVQKSLPFVNRMLPSSSPKAAATAVSSWKEPPTIFGILASGSDRTPTVENGSNLSSPFELCLGPAAFIHVVFTNISLTNVPTSLDKIAERTKVRSPPGKFYRQGAAMTILDTLRTGGSAAEVLPASNATSEEKTLFNRFRQRLDGGDLFIAMASNEILAFCSSKSEMNFRRMNFPASFLFLRESVLVSRVVLQNYSAYAEATAYADDSAL